MLLLPDSSMNKQPQKTQSIQKTFHFIRLCTTFSADHFDEETF
jgi:hypothetical protein